MEPAAALVRDLQREVLTEMLHTEQDARPEEGTVVVLAGRDGERRWSALEEPGPDDHRVAHLEREVGALIVEHAPAAVAIGTAVRGVPDPHETLVIWAAERGGETLAMRMHTILTWDGLLVPGPLGRLDATEAGLAPTLVDALRACA